MQLELNVNGPGDPYTIDHTALSVTFNPGRLSAYGEVLAGVLEGDATLSVRGDSAVQGWKVVEPFLQAWRDGKAPLDEYAARLGRSRELGQHRLLTPRRPADRWPTGGAWRARHAPPVRPPVARRSVR